MSKIFIGESLLKNYGRPYIVAEAGINHNGDIDNAFKMIEVAKASGVDSIKFQTFKAKEFCGDKNQQFTYKSQGQEITESMFEMFQRYEFSSKEWLQIKQKCDDEEIVFLSTPQNRSDLNLLLDIGISAIKVGSDDFTNLPLLEDYASTGLPIILSCGMSDQAEVYQALEAIGYFDGYPVILLLCTSQYPTPPVDVNILKLKTLAKSFNKLVLGFSDHTQGTLASSLAVSQGAVFFEKHFTLDNNMQGPDHWFSENPASLKSWVESIHLSHRMMGSSIIKPTEEEIKMKKIARRSIVVLKSINKGAKFTEGNIGLRRPGNGLPPSMFEEIIGSYAGNDLKEGSLLRIKDVR